jgi:NAD+ diphosphatase
MTDLPLGFVGNGLERAVPESGDAGVVAASAEDARGRYLVLRALEVPVAGEDAALRLAWVGREDALNVSGAGGDDVSLILLGFEDGVPHFAVGSGVGVASEEGEAGAGGARYIDARAAGVVLGEHEASVVAQARSMVEWHSRTGFCGRCGGATESVGLGSRRVCGLCGERHYPRVDPSIIVLVEHEGRALLAGRNGGAVGRRSCVAGFVEPGESVEEAVRREVMEETGVRVGAVQYTSSQPWPFPSTLMLGCRAQATSAEIEVDGTEISHAEWYTRDEVRSALDGTSEVLGVPPPLAIAHHLMRDWVDEGA